MDKLVAGTSIEPEVPEAVLRDLGKSLERAGFTREEIQMLAVTPLLLMQIKQVLQGRIPEIKLVPIEKEYLKPYTPHIFCSVRKDGRLSEVLVECAQRLSIDVLVRDTDVFDELDNHVASDDEDKEIYFIRLTVNDFHFLARRIYAPQILNLDMLREWSERSLSGWEVSFCQPADVLRIALLDNVETLVRKPIRIAMEPIIIGGSREIFQIQYIGTKLSIVPIPAGNTAVFPRHLPLLFRLSKTELV